MPGGSHDAGDGHRHKHDDGHRRKHTSSHRDDDREHHRASGDSSERHDRRHHHHASSGGHTDSSGRRHGSNRDDSEHRHHRHRHGATTSDRNEGSPGHRHHSRPTSSDRNTSDTKDRHDWQDFIVSGSAGERRKERSPRPSSSGHRHSPRSSKEHQHHRSRDGTSTSSPKPRKGLRILVCSGNLGNKLPNETSMSAWIPRKGRVKDLLNDHSKHRVPGIGRDLNNVDNSGSFEVIVIGMQESIPGSNPIISSGVTTQAGGGGGGIFQRTVGVVTHPLGKLGKPVEELASGLDHMVTLCDDNVGGTKELRKLIERQVGEEYAFLSQFQRGEMRLYVLVRKDYEDRASIKVRAENTGLGHFLANKGGIAAELTLDSTRIAFISMHLEAHEGDSHYKKRNDDIAEILKGTKDPTISAHHSFVLGDLNYRVRLPNFDRGEVQSKKEQLAVCQKLVSQKDWKGLNLNDELALALKERHCLVGFETPCCMFPPTFKLERLAGYAYDKSRIPSYTDRILWKSNQESRNVEGLIYEPIGHFDTSDHKPIRGVFFLPERRPLKLDPKKNMLHVFIKKMKCKDLEPPHDAMHSDLDSYIEFKSMPEMMTGSKGKDDVKTPVVKSSNRPWWPSTEMHFTFKVPGDAEIDGAFLIAHVRLSKLTGDVPIGAATIDLEALSRSKEDVSIKQAIFRGGKEVGQFCCVMQVRWT